MNTRTILCSLLALGLVASVLHAEEDSKLWTVDFEKAKETAKSENKDILMEFTGSDWCPPCQALHREVLTKEVFQKKTPEQFVLLKLDNPRDKSKQSEEEQQQYQELSSRYAIRGVPTIILADAEGRPYAKNVGYGGTAAEEYVENLLAKTAIREKRDELLAKAEAAEGTEKARLLDQALSTLDDEIAKVGYEGVVDQIIAADADDEGGLKTKYQESRRTAQLRQELNQVQQSFDPAAPEATLKKINALIDDFEPKGEALQQPLYLKGVILFRMQEKEKARKALESALKLAPESRLGQQIEQVLKSAFGDSTPEQ